MKNDALFKKRYDVSCETYEKFKIYHNEILLCQEKFNLIGKGTLEKIWSRHFSDCAEILKTFEFSKSKKILDFGTGAGLPGLVLALLSEDRKLDHNITLVESNIKKFGFLKKVIHKLNLNISVFNERVENFSDRNFDIITARAVAPIKKLLHYLRKFNLKNTALIFPKGKTWSKEIDTIKNNWKFNEYIVKNNQKLDATGGAIIIIRNLKKK